MEKFDAIELEKWRTWFRLRPPNDEIPIQLALLRRQIGAYLGGSKDIYDYLPPGTYRPKPADQSPEEMYAAFCAFTGRTDR